MHELTNLEIMLLIKEFQVYEGAYIEKFYETGSDTFRLRIKKDRETTDILCILCKALCKTRYIEKSDEPTNFCLAVRKRIL